MQRTRSRQLLALPSLPMLTFLVMRVSRNPARQGRRHVAKSLLRHPPSRRAMTAQRLQCQFWRVISRVRRWRSPRAVSRQERPCRRWKIEEWGKRIKDSASTRRGAFAVRLSSGQHLGNVILSVRIFVRLLRNCCNCFRGLTFLVFVSFKFGLLNLIVFKVDLFCKLFS